MPRLGFYYFKQGLMILLKLHEFEVWWICWGWPPGRPGTLVYVPDSFWPSLHLLVRDLWPYAYKNYLLWMLSKFSSLHDCAPGTCCGHSMIHFDHPCTWCLACIWRQSGCFLSPVDAWLSSWDMLWAKHDSFWPLLHLFASCMQLEALWVLLKKALYKFSSSDGLWSHIAFWGVAWRI
jgi:hypothetical protein